MVEKFISMFFLGNTMHTRFEVKNMTEQSVGVLYHTSVSYYGTAPAYAFTRNLLFSHAIKETPLTEIIVFDQIIEKFHSGNDELLHT